MSDYDAELSRRVEREIARELASGVDNPVIARIRKHRRETAREADYDPVKYAEIVRARTAPMIAQLNLKTVTREELEQLRKQDDKAAAKGGKSQLGVRQGG